MCGGGGGQGVCHFLFASVDDKVIPKSEYVKKHEFSP